MFIYTISLGAARFTFLRENERVNSNYNLGINVKLYLILSMGWSTLKYYVRKIRILGKHEIQYLIVLYFKKKSTKNTSST